MKLGLKFLLASFIAIIFICCDGTSETFASTGTITGLNAYSWGENIGWINFKANGSNVSVSDTALSGYAWSSNYGWINLSPTSSGVTNTCSGELGGYAWSGTLGWIHFAGGSINANGKFVGTIGTSGSSAGRIKLDCSNCSIITNWRPSCDSSSSSNGSSNNSNDSSANKNTPPSCNATKPSNAPVILKTNAGKNAVTLTWSQTSDQLTNYFIAYGRSSESIEYGNPNIGDANSKSYTVTNLSGGTKYYFKIKAINDCMPGDFSNEVEATPDGNTAVQSPAENFMPVSYITNQFYEKQSNHNAKRATPVQKKTIVQVKSITYLHSLWLMVLVAGFIIIIALKSRRKKKHDK